MQNWPKFCDPPPHLFEDVISKWTLILNSETFTISIRAQVSEYLDISLLLFVLVRHASYIFSKWFCFVLSKYRVCSEILQNTSFASIYSPIRYFLKTVFQLYWMLEVKLVFHIGTPSFKCNTVLGILLLVRKTFIKTNINHKSKYRISQVSHEN